MDKGSVSLGRVVDILEASGAFDPGSNPGRGAFSFLMCYSGNNCTRCTFFFTFFPDIRGHTVKKGDIYQKIRPDAKIAIMAKPTMVTARPLIIA